MSSVSPQPKSTKARDSAKSGSHGIKAHGKGSTGTGNAGGKSTADNVHVKGKTQLAKDYYMMQAFVQQTNNQMQMLASGGASVGLGSSVGSRPESITHSASSTVKKSQSHKHQSKDQQLVSASEHKKGTIEPSATYYTTKATMLKT